MSGTSHSRRETRGSGPGLFPARCWAALTALLFFAGCGRNGYEPRSGYDPPNLNGAYRDDDGVLRTVVHSLAVIAFGDRVEGELVGADQLIGYEFEAFAATRPIVELQVVGEGVCPALALYGPRSEQGLWGDPLAVETRDDPGSLLLADLEIEAAGVYLILVQNRSASVRAAYVLQLGCQGNCGPPICPEMQPCDRFCDLGFVFDEQGCRLCECLGLAECGPDRPCPTGHTCDDEARCRPIPDPCNDCPGVFEPVCGVDGRTYGNPCRAECAGVEVLRPGHCEEPGRCGPERPCPGDLVCRQEHCVEPDCRCPEVEEPVCSHTGRTWRNLCELECRPGEELAYFGVCRERGCMHNEQCPEGLFCLPIREPENIEICMEEPRSPHCLKECRPPDMRRCQGGRGCERGETCYPLDPEGHGVCLPLCRVTEDPAEGCPEHHRCAALSEDRGEPGVCLPACSRADAQCPFGLRCMQDARGLPVCQACICPEDPDAQPVCGRDNRTYPSECAARCAGMEWFREGACEDAPTCICPRAPDPVCGTDRVIYNNLCEARCAEQRSVELELCFDEPVSLFCERHEDCFRTGCSRSVCASEQSAACPRYSGEAMCHVRHGECGCVHERCIFRGTPESIHCIERVRGDRG